MRITIIPGACSNEYRNTSDSFCASCLASFLMHEGNVDLPCISATEDDGADDTTLVLEYNGHEEIIPLTPERREELALGGWKGWIEYVEQLPGAKSV